MKTKKLHYGYVILALLFATQVMVFVGSRSVSIALLDIQESLGVTVAEMGLIVAWYNGMANLGSILWGGIGDKKGPRWSALAAGFVFSTGMVLCGMFGGTSYILAIILWTITGFGSSGLQETVIPKLISAWFVPNRRGSALRVVTPGGPIVSMILGVVMPIGLTNYGWGPTFVFLGCVCYVITLVFLLIRTTPAEKGLDPVGYEEGVSFLTEQEEGSRESSDESKGLYRRALRLPITWHVGAIYILYQYYFFTNTTYYASAIRQIGFTTAEAGLIVTLVGITSILAMQVWGPLSDRIGRKRALQIILICASVYPFATFLMYQSSPSYFVLAAMILVGQFFCFSGAPIFMAILSDYFPTELSATCNGIVSGLSSIGSFLAPLVGGLVIDGIGGGAICWYCIPVAVGAMLCLVAIWKLPNTVVDIKKSKKQEKPEV